MNTCMLYIFFYRTNLPCSFPNVIEIIGQKALEEIGLNICKLSRVIMKYSLLECTYSL